MSQWSHPQDVSPLYKGYNGVTLKMFLLFTKATGASHLERLTSLKEIVMAKGKILGMQSPGMIGRCSLIREWDVMFDWSWSLSRSKNGKEISLYVSGCQPGSWKKERKRSNICNFLKLLSRG